MKKVVKFMKECRSEMKKVVWPTPASVVSSSRVVAISIVLFAIAFGLVDLLFVRLIEWIY